MNDKITKNFRLGLFLTALSVLGAGCQENFIYVQKPVNEVSLQPKVKEILGNTQVDIIWQVGGMTELESTLLKGADSFMTLMSQQSTLDWKIGVISTDPSQDQFLGFLPNSPFDAHTSNPVPIFDAAVKQVIDSYDGEKMMDPVDQILTKYPNFIRPNALLVLIVTNDNHDESSMDVTTFLNKMKALKGDLSKVIVYGVLGSLDLGCDRMQIDEDWNYAGSTYETVIAGTHGQKYSLCTDDFGSSLGKIGDSIINSVSHPKIFLQSRPVPSTIVVKYQGNPLPSGSADAGGVWTYDYGMNAIIFSDLKFASNNEDSVQITYKEDNGTN